MTTPAETPAETWSISDLLAIHYQRLDEMQRNPASRISHAELKQKLAERKSTRLDSATKPSDAAT